MTTHTVMTGEDWLRMPDNGKRYELVPRELSEYVAAGVRLMWL
jgi:hypothetical protein